MALWPVNLTDLDKELVVQLAQRRIDLGLTPHTLAGSIRSAVRFALAATDDQLQKGNEE